jgi:endoglucanase
MQTGIRNFAAALAAVALAACSDDTPFTAGSAGSGAASDGGGAGGASGSGGTAGRGGAGGSAGSAGGAGTGGSGAGASGGLRIQGNRIVTPDGKPFHGRGANLHDTRSCNACAYMAPNVAGLQRWANELIDNWKANFIRFNLWSWGAAEGRVQWRTLTEDAGYLADIKTVVTHMTSKPGVHVMITVFLDPTKDEETGWPSTATIPVYEKLAETFADNPRVLFALTNEPFADESMNPALERLYLQAIDAIRAVERARSAPEHIVVVQAPQLWSRYLDYFVNKPIMRTNVAYEVHAYNPQEEFEELITVPSRTLPILIGEYGPAAIDGTVLMEESDVRALWTLCKSLEVPHIAWNFHHRCEPDLLRDTGGDGCLLSPGYNFPREAWGDMLYEYLNTAW